MRDGNQNRQCSKKNVYPVGRKANTVLDIILG